ncbi:MAG: alpha/beta hydrolase [Gammaproteobacteria bacterium]
MSELLPAVEINPSGAVTASVIFLHGLGADGHDLTSLAAELDLPGARFVFPHAPVRPVTINGGYRMRAWYDVLGADFGTTQDEAGIRESEQRVRALIRREVERGVSAHRIVLVGFSQGAAIALHTALRYPERLAGALALSGYLPLGETLRAEAHPANKDLPIMLAHGAEDTVIPLTLGEASCRKLAALGYPVTWRSYPMPHTLCAEEIEDVKGWLKRILLL